MTDARERAGRTKKMDAWLAAASGADWGQVIANGGPPCFHLENGRFCLRAARWEGHRKATAHGYLPLDMLLAQIRAEVE